MAQIEKGDFLNTGPFSVTGEFYVIAANTGRGYGNTVARCFPIREGEKTAISAAEVATLLAQLLNERMVR